MPKKPAKMKLHHRIREILLRLTRELTPEETEIMRLVDETTKAEFTNMPFVHEMDCKAPSTGFEQDCTCEK